MTTYARVIGIPGAGKTTRAIELIRLMRERGIPLRRIGYSTFTRAGRREASKRAAEAFGESLDGLEREGWFRTIHSACMRLLGTQKGELVNGDRDWFRGVLGEKVETEADEEEDWANQFKGENPIALTLRLWDIARARLLSFSEVLDEAKDLAGPSRELQRVEEHWVEVYEAAKQRDRRYDFTDYIGRYAGVSFTLAGPRSVAAAGALPELPAWIFDEAQDTTPLLDLAAKRLSTGAQWVYLFGDPLQGIYTFSGADPKVFMAWPVEAEQRLTKTYRCSAAVLGLATRLIYNNRDFTRELMELVLEPASEGGDILEADTGSWLGDVNPEIPTLVMSRTNRGAIEMGDQLTAAGIPWRSVKHGGRFPKLTAAKLCEAFDTLEAGFGIDGEAWSRIVDVVPKELLQRGAKTRCRNKEYRQALPVITADEIDHSQFGGTAALRQQVLSGAWRELVEPEALVTLACLKKHGDLAKHPQVLVSTIHGTKGMEAEEVFIDTSIGGPVIRALQSEDGREEERRVWYTGVTRAKSKLVLVRSQRLTNYGEVYDCL